MLTCRTAIAKSRLEIQMIQPEAQSDHAARNFNLLFVGKEEGSIIPVYSLYNPYKLCSLIPCGPQ